VILQAANDIVNNFWLNTLRRTDFNPGINPADGDKPFDTGVYLTADESKLLAGKQTTDYIVDSMSGTCSGSEHNGESGQVLILNWYGFQLFDGTPLC
jgi:hypothetical protein